MEKHIRKTNSRKRYLPESTLAQYRHMASPQPQTRSTATELNPTHCLYCYGGTFVDYRADNLRYRRSDDYFPISAAAKNVFGVTVFECERLTSFGDSYKYNFVSFPPHCKCTTRVEKTTGSVEKQNNVWDRLPSVPSSGVRHSLQLPKVHVVSGKPIHPTKYQAITLWCFCWCIWILQLLQLRQHERWILA